jgi:hypothetical protein
MLSTSLANKLNCKPVNSWVVAVEQHVNIAFQQPIH